MCKFKMTILAGSCALLTVPMSAEECGKEPIARAAIGEHAETEADRGTNGAVRIPVTRDQVSRFGIMIAPATTGTVIRSMKASGEIRVDPDRVAHVVPLAHGIVRQVVKTVGDTVQTGEILAWIESAELAEAKLDFYARESESARSGLRLPQTRAIYENTSRLIALLRAEADNETIDALEGLEMGAYRGQLLTAHAAYRAAGTIHARESGLRASAVNSEQDLLMAETALAQTQATFHALLDTARFEVLMACTEALQQHRVNEFNAAAALTRLRQHGADDAALAALRALVPGAADLQAGLHGSAHEAQDGKPLLMKALDGEGRFAWYALRAPFAGTVTERHVALGESVNTAEKIFTIADLSRVRAELALSQESITDVRAGHSMTIRISGGVPHETTVQYISPLVDSETRTVTARATVNNEGGLFRPGAFIEGVIHIPSGHEALLVPKAAVQLVYDHTCVFVWSDGAFELREVQTGITDGRQIEILRGLHSGERVAAVNAFHLKAELIKSAAGDMGACHGHAH